MKEFTLLDLLRQTSLNEINEVFRSCIKDITKDAVVSAMFQEVEELCGVLYDPKPDSEFKRGGSAIGRIALNGVYKEVIRPRVRYSSGGNNCEKNLLSYVAAKNGDEVASMILRALNAGVSSRDMKKVHLGVAGANRSSVSRLWIAEGLRRIEILRGRELSGENFFCLMLDGVELSSDLTAIVALGITTDGRKLMLDFELGSSESKEVCNALLDRLIRRGFSNVKGARLLAVLDGSKALKNSVLEKFMNPLIQRCLVHKERNIRACLSRRHYGDLSRLFNNLREAQGAEAGREKLREIKNFLADKNKKALDSLEEAGEDLLALHVIGAPSSLNISLLSTNCIENSFKNVRRKIGRVNRWRTETNQAERWLAYALLEAENGFVRIKGWTDIPLLIEALWKHETV